MDVQLQNTLTFLAVAITVVLIAQTFILLAFVLTFRKWCNRTGELMDEISRNVEPTLRAARDLLAESKERLNVISANITEITQLTKGQIAKLDGFVTEASDRARLQLIRLDQLVSNTVGRLEETTEAVQRSVLAPVREISAILAGVRATLDFLFRRNKSGVERATHDEELFI